MSETARINRKNKGGRSKKRKFYGNQYSKTQDSSEASPLKKKLHSKFKFLYEVSSDINLEITYFINVFNTIASLLV